MGKDVSKTLKIESSWPVSWQMVFLFVIVAEIKATIKLNFKIKASLEAVAAPDSCQSSAITQFGFVRAIVLSC